jgi:uncharacterized phage protein gp47/JayE
MAITVPDREQLITDLLAYLHALLPEITPTRDSDIGVRMQMLADGLLGLHVNVAAVQEDLFPATASREALELHAETRLGEGARLGATKATGLAALKVLGTPGSTIAAGATGAHTSGARYALLTGGTIPAVGDPEIECDVESITLGTAANRAVGDKITLENPPAGITAQAEVVSPGIAGAIDEESDADLLVRVLHAIQNPPAGGRFSDYWTWAREVSGVAEAYVYGPSSAAPTGRRGLGIVDVVVTARGTGAARAPSATLVAAAKESVLAQCPACTRDVAVLAPTITNVAWLINVLPHVGYGWDSTWTTGEVVSWDAATRTLTWAAPVPAALLAGHRIMCWGEVHVVESVAGSTTVLKTAFVEGPPGSAAIYPAGPLSQPVQQAIRDYMDTMGPARGTAADPEQTWDDQLLAARAYAVVMGVPGVKNVTFTSPTFPVVPTDPGYPDAPALLVYNYVIVRPL